MRKKICVVYGESTMIEHVKSGLQSFVLEISLRMTLHGQADQLKLIAFKSRHSLRTANIAPRGR